MALSKSEVEKLRDLYVQNKRYPHCEKRIYYNTWPWLDDDEHMEHSDYQRLRDEELIAYVKWQRKTFSARILMKGIKYIERYLMRITS